MFITLFLLSIVFVEALTELLAKSLIFARPREILMEKNEFIKGVLSCGYCTSVWVAIFPALLLCTIQTFCAPIIAFPLIWLSLHRLSNYLHNINDKYFDKFFSK